ncbi:MAG: hypothetical protein EGP96_01845 [Roseburia inulinivorans]|nr:hypothetical protein [Roseburia inulinivorans]
MNPDTGEITHFYKVIKFARVIRLPANAKQSTALMDMQEQILAGVHERNYNMITIIVNVIKPVALGLLYLYGIQGVAESLEKAKEKAYYDFKGERMYLRDMDIVREVINLNYMKKQE